MRTWIYDQKSLRVRHRGGANLVELMVVMTVIAILVAIAVPAIQSARNMSRRWTCTNQLRQIGIGLMVYHESSQLFPFGWQCQSRDPFYRASAQDYMWSGWSQLLPQIEANSLYDSINFDLPVDFRANITSIANHQSIFMCPTAQTDPTTLDRTSRKGVLDYAMNSGTRSHPESGIMYRNSNIDHTAIIDGLSHTFMVAEASMFSERDRRRWALGSSACIVTNVSTSSPGQHFDNDSDNWRRGHDQGINVLMADGAVRFFSAQMPRSLLTAMSTRDQADRLEYP